MQSVLNVDGMTCQHCVQTVNETVGKMAGVEKVVVDLDQKKVTVNYDDSKSKLDDISARIVEAGFQVTGS